MYAARQGTIGLVFEPGGSGVSLHARSVPPCPGSILMDRSIPSSPGVFLRVQEYLSMFRSIPPSRSIPPCPEATTMGWTREVVDCRQMYTGYIILWFCFETDMQVKDFAATFYAAHANDWQEYLV